MIHTPYNLYIQYITFNSKNYLDEYNNKCKLKVNISFLKIYKKGEGKTYIKFDRHFDIHFLVFKINI